eukprot:TRINITY_DN12099_c0_g1_i1.p1 TRINITY_DN12099_c0_g1~~TRINITY_DN12099_c0_g1_i1.p1  ORF type:complete len:778 (+),score=108.65 TRINITY_DN12099_c0_g1_i1:67-2334(+)
MELVPRQSFTIPHEKPVWTGKISKRQLEKLPNFGCHCFVPQRDTLYAGTLNGSVASWRSVRQLRATTVDTPEILGQHRGAVTCMVWHEHFRFLFSGSVDSTIKVWDVAAKNKCIQTVLAHDGTVTALGAHCNALLSASSDSTVKLWKADEHRPNTLYAWFIVRQTFVFDSWASSIACSQKKAAEDSLGEIYIGDSSGGLTVMRSIAEHWVDLETVLVDTVELVKHVKGFRRLGVTRVMPVPTINALLSLSWDHLVQFNDIATFQVLTSVENTRASSRFVDFAWNSVQDELVLVDDEGFVTAWDLRTNHILHSAELASQLQRVTCATSASGDQFCLVSSRDAVLLLTMRRFIPFTEHPGHTARVVGLHLQQRAKISRATAEFDSLEVYLYSSSQDNTVCTWRLPDEETENLGIVKTLREPRSEVSAFRCVDLPSGLLVATGHDDGSLQLWNPHGGRISRVKGHQNTLSCLTVGLHKKRGGRYEARPHIVSVGFDGQLGVWDIRRDEGSQPRCEGMFPVCLSEVLCVVYDPLHYTYITGGNDGVVRIWAISGCRKVAELESPAAVGQSHLEAVTCLSLDGNYLFSGSEDKTINMWSLYDHTLLRVLGNHNGEVTALVVMKETGAVLSCARDGEMKLWCQDGSCPFTFSVSHELTALTYRTTGTGANEVYLGTEAGSILLVHVPDPPKPVAAVIAAPVPTPPGRNPAFTQRTRQPSSGPDLLQSLAATDFGDKRTTLGGLLGELSPTSLLPRRRKRFV